MTDDATLLRLHATGQSEAAFAEFVQRHLPLVYSAAVRRLGGDTHRAEDITQIVFCAAARKAEKLSHHTMLTGWLYTATRNAVTDVVRSEQRRQAREAAVARLTPAEADSDPACDWSHLRPVLDEVMDELSDADREAVLLRYFEGRSFAEIGTALSTSDEAARKRVDRALDKLRDLLTRRKIVSTSAAIATVLAAETALAAPAGLATTVTTAAVAAGGGAMAGTATFFALTKFHVAAAALLATGVVGITIHQLTEPSSPESPTSSSPSLTAPVSALAASVSPATASTTSATSSRAAKTSSGQTPSAALANSLPTRPASPLNAPDPPPANLSVASARTADASPATDPAAAPLSHPPVVVTDGQQTIWHRRFDRFARRHNLTSEQVNRLIELWWRKAAVAQDLQAAVELQGLRGDTAGIDALRSKLNAPITAELRQILGPEVSTAYNLAEMESFYRANYVDPVLPEFAQAHVPLSEDQIARLIEIIGANNRGERVKPTDLGKLTHIDWTAVATQSANFLTPPQLTVLRAYAIRTP